MVEWFQPLMPVLSGPKRFGISYRGRYTTSREHSYLLLAVAVAWRLLLLLLPLDSGYVGQEQLRLLCTW